MHCPRDRHELVSVRLDHAACYACRSCGGRALTIPLLRRMAPRERLHALWSLVRASTEAGAACPSCGRPMRLVAAGDGAATVHLDGCATCQIVWFDVEELRVVAPDPASPAPVLDAPVPADLVGDRFWNERLKARIYFVLSILT